MAVRSKKTFRSTKRSAKSAKILIWTAALAATFGGWVAMSNDGSASLASQPQIVSTSQVSLMDGPQLVDGASSSVQPPAPIARTRSSR